MKAEKLKLNVKKGLDNPRRLLTKLLETYPWLSSDEFYLKLLFKDRTGYKLDLENPQTYNEKLQWLKLYYRKPEFSKLVDKYEVKKYVSDLIGEECVIPTYGVWDSFDEIDFDKLPNQFVLKTTHDSGGYVLCPDKSKFDYKKAKERLEYRRQTNRAIVVQREYVYENVPARIIAEKYLENKEVGELRDYKFFCFDGIPRALFVASNRQNPEEGLKFDYFDIDFNRLDFSFAYPPSNKHIEKPKTFDQMVDAARILSRGYPHIRVDFYETEGKMYFGELTFFHGGGVKIFNPKKWDYIFGSWINLPKKEVLV